MTETKEMMQTMDQIERVLAPLPETHGPKITPRAESVERVRWHRERMAKDGCARLDITIGADTLEKLKAVAKKQSIPLWQAAEEAFEDAAIKHGL